MSNVPAGSPVYGMINDKKFRRGLRPAKKPQRVRKRLHLFNGMTPRLKIVSNLPLGFPEYRMTNAIHFRWGFSPASNPKR